LEQEGDISVEKISGVAWVGDVQLLMAALKSVDELVHPQGTIP